MGKYSSMPRRARDFYATPAKATLPLLPHLKTNTKFSEPCCGDLALVRHLERAGHKCYFASDIENRCTPETVAGEWVHTTALEIDALRVTTPLSQADCVITNPPFSKEILFPLIEHFRKYNQTWLLLPADFAHNVGSAPYLEYCSKIVSIGRIKWIPDSKHTGKENYSWYCFEMKKCKTVFFSR